MLNSASTTQSVYENQAITQATTNNSTEASGYSTNISGDTLSLSDGSRLISTFFAGLGVEYTPGTSITLDDLKQGLARSEEQFRSDVTTLFLQNDISQDPPVELTTDQNGKVRVKGDHPQKEQIEQLFEDNPDLANDFRKIDNLTGLVEAGQEYLEFSAEYDKDPYAAVAKYNHLFNGTDDEAFSLTIGATDENVS